MTGCFHGPSTSSTIFRSSLAIYPPFTHDNMKQLRKKLWLHQNAESLSAIILTPARKVLIQQPVFIVLSYFLIYEGINYLRTGWTSGLFNNPLQLVDQQIVRIMIICFVIYYVPEYWGKSFWSRLLFGLSIDIKKTNCGISLKKGLISKSHSFAGSSFSFQMKDFKRAGISEYLGSYNFNLIIDDRKYKIAEVYGLIECEELVEACNRLVGTPNQFETLDVDPRFN